LIPDSFIDKLLNESNIVDVIAKRVNLKKKGSEYQALCPFHHEKTPSFTVSESKQIFYCFGCKTGGNSISFIKKIDQCSFKEAISYLCSLHNIPLPYETESSSQNYYQNKLRLTNILEDAMNFFTDQLYKYNPAKKYLTDREIHSKSEKTFQLGFAPANSQLLINILSKKGYSKADIQASGLITQNGRSYFFNRLIFPIFNEKKNLIAFGGRNLNSHNPKYLNSPETELFSKKKTLYGLNNIQHLHKPISSILLVEGYIDVISLHQAGIQNVVATLGTALSKHHLLTLSKHTNLLIFCFDGDTGGKQAAWRATQTILKQSLTPIECKFIFLPPREDPDSFIRKYGKAELSKYYKKSTSIISFFFNYLSANINTNSLIGKNIIIKKCLDEVKDMPNSVLKHSIIQHGSKMLNIDPTILEKEIVKNPTLPSKIKITNQSCIQLTEKVVAIMLNHPESIAAIKNLNFFKVEFDQYPYNILNATLDLIIAQTNPKTGLLLQTLSSQFPEKQILNLISLNLMIEPDRLFYEARDGLIKIKKLYLEQKIKIILENARNKNITKNTEQQLTTMINHKNLLHKLDKNIKSIAT
jgi:DNA primase